MPVKVNFQNCWRIRDDVKGSKDSRTSIMCEFQARGEEANNLDMAVTDNDLKPYLEDFDYNFHLKTKMLCLKKDLGPVSHSDMNHQARLHAEEFEKELNKALGVVFS